MSQHLLPCCCARWGLAGAENLAAFHFQTCSLWLLATQSCCKITTLCKVVVTIWSAKVAWLLLFLTAWQGGKRNHSFFFTWKISTNHFCVPLLYLTLLVTLTSSHLPAYVAQGMGHLEKLPTAMNDKSRHVSPPAGPST